MPMGLLQTPEQANQAFRSICPSGRKGTARNRKSPRKGAEDFGTKTSRVTVPEEFLLYDVTLKIETRRNPKNCD